MNLPHKIKTDIEFIDGDGSARTDVAIYAEHLVCHPNKLIYIVDMFKNSMGINLEIIK